MVRCIRPRGAPLAHQRPVDINIRDLVTDAVVETPAENGAGIGLAQLHPELAVAFVSAPVIHHGIGPRIVVRVLPAPGLATVRVVVRGAFRDGVADIQLVSEQIALADDTIHPVVELVPIVVRTGKSNLYRDRRLPCGERGWNTERTVEPLVDGIRSRGRPLAYQRPVYIHIRDLVADTVIEPTHQYRPRIRRIQSHRECAVSLVRTAVVGDFS